ncbi:AGE family epimerase/isomerase [Polymorphum gilvum]|uniref:N-acylglucosamine 2-epimerase superfamily n=1 Tax=Polymorphum gilvum (strain LMG 25793 / CGMCC 1.9160 / SL003B-26A1) TaxID=991905 RepID=F2J5W2_POLGS|nr:AGE family epimerase/isomerase [Polymorphum gilvum]ADZ71216.1 N-acylglucosamine 2-epimerase superfamily [Polymorphum gilvum SL003B-26A1]
MTIDQPPAARDAPAPDEAGDVSRAVKAMAEEMRGWLFAAALPRWHAAGIDRERGGFHEAIDVATGAAVDAPRRARVQPRQVYSFLEAGRMGWDGDWRTPAREGLALFLERYGLGDGTVGALVSAEGALLDPGFDLYNQAFALFALAHAAAEDAGRAPAYRERAARLLARLKAACGHPAGGFHEGAPERLPLCSNPHMHLFEAALAWEAAGGGPAWTALADEIAGLALERFIDATSGGLREFFDADWRPMPDARGRILEPGHQFEWAWLLVRWGTARGEARALAAARRLFAIGEEHGVCPDRQVAMMALDERFAVLDPVARLWAQTEWLKAALALAEIAEGAAARRAYLGSALRAGAALRPYLDVPLAGLWRDKLEADGRFRDEPAPASSFYHIVCALSELDAHARRL